MTQYYECHITFEGDPAEGRDVVQVVGWKYSRIDGDPILGDGVRQYATKHYSAARFTEEGLWALMECIKVLIDHRPSLKVTRCKIELVLRDERY